VDISGSNLNNIDKTINKINTIYQESRPNDRYKVVFFSSVKYLAYTGGRLAKDRDFMPLIQSGLESAKKIEVKKGTSFEICRHEIESSPDSKIYLFTDGHFEDSDLTVIKLPSDTKVEIFGLNISNNDRILNSFDNQDKVTINFQDN
jgi:hypothetical protein